MAIILDLWLTNPLLVGASLVIFIYANLYLIKLGHRMWNLSIANYYKQAFYVANPSQREMIHENKPIRRKIIIYWFGQVLVVSVLSTFLLLGSPSIHSLIIIFTEIFLGLIFCRYIRLITNNLENIYLFRFLINNPQSLKGQVMVSNSFVYGGLRRTVLIHALIWLLIFISVGWLFFLGGFLGSLLYIHSISAWERQSENINPP